MNPLRHIRRIVGVLVGLAAALLASGATPAFAMRVPDPRQPYPAASLPPAQVPAQIHTVTRIIVAGGMPGWQIALIVPAPRCWRPRWRCSRTGHEPPADA